MSCDGSNHRSRTEDKTAFIADGVRSINPYHRGLVVQRWMRLRCPTAHTCNAGPVAGHPRSVTQPAKKSLVMPLMESFKLELSLSSKSGPKPPLFHSVPFVGLTTARNVQQQIARKKVSSVLLWSRFKRRTEMTRTILWPAMIGLVVLVEHIAMGQIVGPARRAAAGTAAAAGALVSGLVSKIVKPTGEPRPATVGVTPITAINGGTTRRKTPGCITKTTHGHPMMLQHIAVSSRRLQWCLRAMAPTRTHGGRSQR